MAESWISAAQTATGKKPLLWEAMTWPQLESLHDQGHDLVILPVGATEQHGPHLPVCTDNAIATAVCAYASAKTGVPMLPTMNYSVSVGHTKKWHGTLSLVHETLANSVCEISEWLFDKGWRRLLIINAHMGNKATLGVAVDRLRCQYLERAQVNVLDTFTLAPPIFKYFTCDGDDIHANRAETDLMLHLDPAACDMASVQDDPDRTGATVFSYPVALTSKNGVTGEPSKGTAKRGKELYIEMGEALAELIERAKVETAPLSTESK